MRRAALASGALFASALVAAPTVAAAGATSGDDIQTTVVEAQSGLTAKQAAAFGVASVRRNVTAGKSIVVAGVIKPLVAGRPVVLQVRARRGWRTIDRDVTGGRGEFRVSWRASAPGTRRVRLRFEGTDHLSSASRSLGSVNVYRTAMASWYGPGLYGNKLSCGGRLSPGTVGVAHKQLPCGAKVTLRYRGRTVRARVVDRGPFVAGREFDLTAATRAKLRFGSTGRIQVSTG